MDLLFLHLYQCVFYTAVSQLQKVPCVFLCLVYFSNKAAVCSWRVWSRHHSKKPHLKLNTSKIPAALVNIACISYVFAKDVFHLNQRGQWEGCLWTIFIGAFTLMSQIRASYRNVPVKHERCFEVSKILYVTNNEHWLIRLHASPTARLNLENIVHLYPHVQGVTKNMEHVVKSWLKQDLICMPTCLWRLTFHKQHALINSEGKRSNLAQSLLLIKISQLLRLSERLHSRNPSVFTCLFFIKFCTCVGFVRVCLWVLRCTSLRVDVCVHRHWRLEMLCITPCLCAAMGDWV